ncbi:MAG: hypothetical protein AB9872_12175 [Solidesulfovibrio sp.]
MKVWTACIVMMALLAVTSFAFAEENTPSVLGKWKTESTGGMLLHGKKQSSGTHWEPKQKVLHGQIEFLSQDGRFVTGIYTSSRAAEKFIGMLSADGKTIYAADSDGYWDCKIIDNDTFELVYRHVKPTDTVVAIGIAKRQK